MKCASRFLASAVAVLALAALAPSACSSGQPPALGDQPGQPGTGSGETCATPHAGCPCDVAGEVAPCGKVIQRSGDYLTCSMGTITCDGTQWGACAGDRFVTKSAAGRTLDANGLHVTSNSIPCTNECDPYCKSTGSGPRDVPDASGVSVSEGGVTLVAGDASGATACTGLECDVAACGAGPKTTITGTVYDPAGKNPLYDAYVYVPLDRTTPLPAFATGATCDTCAGSKLDAVAVAQTDAAGNFTLSGVPSGSDIPIVVQMGKWRREIRLSTVTSCTTNVVGGNCTSANRADCQLRLPKNRFDGFNRTTSTYTHADMPKMAMVSGAADPFECMLLKAGIDYEEFTSEDVNKGQRIDYYSSPDAPGSTLAAPFGDDVRGDVLYGNASGAGLLDRYDLVILACEGDSIDKQKTTGGKPYENLIGYADAGGRVFTTHFGYVWLEYPSAHSYVAAPDNWSSVATWTHLTGTTFTQDPLVTTIDTGFPKGVAFSQWLQNVNAAIATTQPSQLNVHEGRQDSRVSYGGSTTSYATAFDGQTSQSFSDVFDFNAPYGSANVCGRVVYSDFHVSALALVDPNSGGACLTDGDCGFGATCSGAVTKLGTCTEPCVNASDCADPSYSCSGGNSGTCAPNVCNAKGRCSVGKCVTGKKGDPCYCTSNAQCGSGACNFLAGKTYGTCATKTCAANADCGNMESCQGGTLGICSKSCSKDADCAGETCVAGKCSGCLSASNCPDQRYKTACNGASQTYGTCTVFDPYEFPYACQQGDLSPQEKALEFLFFDLSACVSPDNAGPPGPPTPKYQPASFTQRYTASCPAGTHVHWREIDWQAAIPNTASIDFAAQTGPTDGGALAPAAPLAVAHATTSTALPNFDVGLVDTGSTGAFDTAHPPIVSLDELLVTITLNPTSDALSAPTLLQWKVQYDCPPAE